ncbi:MAG: hypothetical protein P8N61_01640 [Porticoccaceae bacterium]|nr:hypothetical protein [Porticoccaceae bacterium]
MHSLTREIDKNDDRACDDCAQSVQCQMPNFFKDSIFVFLLIAPLPVWLWLYITKGVTGITDLSVLLSLVLLYPIIEEVLFRGFIQPFLAKRFDQRWLFFHWPMYSLVFYLCWRILLIILQLGRWLCLYLHLFLVMFKNAPTT